MNPKKELDYGVLRFDFVNIVVIVNGFEKKCGLVVVRFENRIDVVFGTEIGIEVAGKLFVFLKFLMNF